MSRKDNPIQCPRCCQRLAMPTRRAAGGLKNGTGSSGNSGGAAGGNGRDGGHASVPVLPKSAGAAKRLREVLPVRVNWLDGEDLSKDPRNDRYRQMVEAGRAQSKSAGQKATES